VYLRLVAASRLSVDTCVCTHMYIYGYITHVYTKIHVCVPASLAASRLSVFCASMACARFPTYTSASGNALKRSGVYCGMGCRVLECVAGCWSVLQGVAVTRGASVVDFVAVWCIV